MTPTVTQGLACICGTWSCFVFLVQGIGLVQLFRNYARPPAPAAVEFLPVPGDDDDHESDQLDPDDHDDRNSLLPNDIHNDPDDPDNPNVPPHVTVIRPVKGLEPELYACLASTFRQSYPPSRLSVALCVESRADPAWPVLVRVVADHPHVDARIYVEAEDPRLHGPGGSSSSPSPQPQPPLGPNPKIRNISRAYREARADHGAVVWIVDCNVWVPPGTAGRMVDKLCGFRPAGARRARPYKFVHQLPLVVALDDNEKKEWTSTTSSSPATPSPGFGSRLDEMFMATSHAKFYSAINTVGVAPCVVGKSNMFRKAHLDRLTAAKDAGGRGRGVGVDYFSSYICEDHLIGDLLWRAPLPGYRNHGFVAGDPAIQPMAGTTVAAYAARRVRWLRVRKWTVLLATLVEPGVEAFLCAAYAAFARTVWVAGAAATTTTTTTLCSTFARTWLAIVAVWLAVDWCTFRRLQACGCVATDAATPYFARGRRGRADGLPRRPLRQWLLAWLVREALALPIWTWAVLLGTTVAWRGKRFRVRMDMSVVEMDDTAAATAAAATVAAERNPTPDTDTSAEAPPACRSRSAGTTNGKARVD